MPLKIVRGRDNQTLWSTCAGRFLERVAEHRGPDGHAAWLWLSHRNLRDSLMELAEARGIPGWLRPPVTHLGGLTELFEIRDRPAGLLTRRRILSRLAGEVGRQVMGREPGRADGVIRGHMLDSLLSDLLPEGVAPERLEEALEGVSGDGFARRRNRWIVEVYRRYLEELERRGLRDWRSVHALVAESIESGALADVLGGARELHVYGITNPRTRRRLLRALADQPDVDVSLYLPLEPEAGELDRLLADAEVETLAPAFTAPSRTDGPLDFQRSPDAAPRTPADADRPEPHADAADGGSAEPAPERDPGDEADGQLSFEQLLAAGPDGDDASPSPATGGSPAAAERQDATPGDRATARDTPSGREGPKARPDGPDRGDSPPSEASRVQVQPAPDAAREIDWVAREVKKLLARGDVEPHRVAVIARSGREDTRRVHRALTRAGVPSSARIRTRMDEIAALKALLSVLRGAGRGWDYRSLRAVLDHPYFDTGVDLRGVDFIATQRRVVGLAAWQQTLERLLELVREEHRDTWGKGLYEDRLEKDIEAFADLREALEPLSEPRTEAEWIELTLELLGRDRGLLFLRRRLCDPVAVGPVGGDDGPDGDGDGANDGDDGDRNASGDPERGSGDAPSRFRMATGAGGGSFAGEVGAPRPALHLVDDASSGSEHDASPDAPGDAGEAPRRGDRDADPSRRRRGSDGPGRRHRSGLSAVGRDSGDASGGDDGGQPPRRHDIVRLDQRGVVQLERLLHEWHQLDHPDEPLEAGPWHALLERLLEANELVLSTPLQKGVQVLEAHDAALVPFDHTFVVHANDGEFPRVSGAGGVLTDAERARLTEAGLPISHRDEALRRERSLWRAVTAQATPVTVTYRTTDPGGTPLLPSLMVPEHRADAELPRTRRWIKTEDARRGRTDALHDPASPAEADQLAADRLARRRWAEATDIPVATPAARPELLRQAVVAAVAEWHRGPGRERAAEPGDHPALRPNPWNGWLRDPEILDWLADRFDESYPWSPSQLETYGRCPFLFLTSRYVLNLEELEEAEEETTPLAFGAAAHEILERYYAELADDLPTAFTSAAREVLDGICDDVFAEREEAGEWLGLPALWATTRETVRRHLHEYVTWELQYLQDKNERPWEVERDFGFGDDEVWLRGRDARGRRAKLRLRGRIDRIDRGGVRKIVHHVLDYKSGGYPSKGGYFDGSTLQGALYLQALADQGLEVRKARYRSLKRPGNPMNASEITYGSKEHETAVRLALSIPPRVRGGMFEAVVAARSDWKPWDPGLELRRNDAQVPEGHRFETSPLRIVDHADGDAVDRDAADGGDEPPPEPGGGPRSLDEEGDDG